MNKKVKVAITITRPHNADDRKVISVKLQDRASGIQFVDVEFPIADFMEALTGLSYVEGEGEVRGLENVGKVRETEDFVFIVAKDLWSKAIEGPWDTRNQRGNEYIKHHFAREGWHVSTRLGSQNAESEKGGLVSIRGLYYRYVDKE